MEKTLLRAFAGGPKVNQGKGGRKTFEFRSEVQLDFSPHSPLELLAEDKLERMRFKTSILSEEGRDK